MTNTHDLASRPHALYRFYNIHGRLLYIGITVDLPTRLGAHHDNKTWWRDVASMTVEPFPDRPTVLAAEKTAITTERPLHNTVHNPRPTAAEPAVGVDLADDEDPRVIALCDTLRQTRQGRPLDPWAWAPATQHDLDQARRIIAQLDAIGAHR